MPCTPCCREGASLKDHRRTPFNIGHAVTLIDFTAAEASVFLRGLGEAEAVNHPALTRVLHWTGGHPYRTQKVEGGDSNR